MPPVTGFESSEYTRNTTAAEERTFLLEVAAETSAVVEVIGKTVLGRNIHSISIGSGSTIAVVANVHPREPAGREAALMWFRDIAYSTDPAVLEYLETHRIVLIPNVNVDGSEAVPRWRSNANGLNINRDYIQLREPESRAVVEKIVLEEPCFIADLHQVSDDQGAGWRPYWESPPDAQPELLDIGSRFVDGASDIIFQKYGYTTKPYQKSLIPWAQLATVASAWNATGVLVEAAYLGPLINAVDLCRDALDYLMEFHRDNSSEMEAAKALSEGVRTTLIKIPTSERVYQGDDIRVPADNVYQLPEDAPLELYALHGIQVSNGAVSLDQPKRSVAAWLLDPQSTEKVLTLDGWDRHETLEPPAESKAEAERKLSYVKANGRLYATESVLSKRGARLYVVSDILVKNSERYISIEG